MSNEPTERQIAYAKDLGIHITFDMTFRELSDLITNKENNDKIASDRHHSFADFYGITYTKYVGKKELYRRIATKLSEPGYERERSSWFVFRVYRSLVRGREGLSVDSVNHPIIQASILPLFMNSSFTNSLKRYDSEETFLWFGSYEAPDGTVYEGASKNTNSYKLAVGELKKYPEVQKDIEYVLNTPLKTKKLATTSNEIHQQEWTMETAPLRIKVLYISLGLLVRIVTFPYRLIKRMIQRVKE